MDIQAVSTPTASTGAGTTAATSKGMTATASKSQGNGFSATLNGLMAAASMGDANNTAPELPLLATLVQLMNQLASTDLTADNAQPDDITKQLDALIELLDAKDGEAEKLLENPDVQAWLAQIQFVFPNQPALIPVEADANKGTAVQLTEAVAQKPLTKEEAIELLKKFKQAVEKDATSPQVKAVQRSVAELFKIQQQPVQQKGMTESTIPFQVTSADSAVPHALEWLAAKTTLPAKLEPATASTDEPLFEPLVDIQSTGNDTQAVPLHEFVKQAPSGAHIAKTPVLIANAPTFAEDMTQLVLKSFTVNTIAEGITEAKLSLYPQHLGQVDVKLTMQNGQLIAQFVAGHAAGKEMLESQLAQLRTTLQNQGIQVEKIEVTQNSSLQSGMFQEQRQQQPQQSAKQQKGNNANKVTSLVDELTQIASEEVQAQGKAPGLRLTSIDTTA